MDEAGPATEPVSTIRGTWSVILAAAAPPVAFLVGVVGSGFVFTQGLSMDALGTVGFVTVVVPVGLLITAVLLGIASIVHASPLEGRPRRSTAIRRGWIGIGLSTVFISVGFLLYLWPQLD